MADEKKQRKIWVPIDAGRRDVAPQTHGTKRALLVGCNYGGSDHALNGCINDIKNVKQMLINMGYRESDIAYMPDNTTGAPNTLGYLPTRDGILRAMSEIVGRTQSGDTLLVHYSGHGTSVVCRDGDEALNPDTPGEDSAICPCDFDKYEGAQGFIVDDEIRKVLVNQLPRSARLITVFDCCHSGSICDLPYIYRDGRGYCREDAVTDAHALCISGCRDQQTSADAYIKGKFSGALTAALIDSLQTVKEQHITWLELLTLIRHYLIVHRYDQVPMLSVGNPDIGAERAML